LDYPGREKRKEPRYPYLRTIECLLCGETNESLKGVTIDISHSGLSLYFIAPGVISEGLKISVKDPLPANLQNGTVQWVVKVEEDFYRAGIMLL
jgi:hypothetical protein